MTGHFTPKPIHCSLLEVPECPQLYFTGPDLTGGKLPALFYFALSGHASLCTDPYNQPVAFLSSSPIRVFSLTLPSHDHEHNFIHAIKDWADSISKGHNIILTFIQKTIKAIDYLVSKGWIDEECIGAAGLSRGGFIAAHLAAADPRIKAILGFAPLTKLTSTKEFAALQENPLANSLNLGQLIDKLIGRKLCFYIGNRDTRVGTGHCFHFLSELVEASYQQHIRSPPVELVVSPSQGQYGHGTLPNIFQDGIDWLCKQLRIQNAIHNIHSNSRIQA